MTVTKLFHLFILRKVTILILLILFNIAAFFAYDAVSMNHQIQLKMQLPISIEGKSLMDEKYLINKFTAGSVMRGVLKGANQTYYKLLTNGSGSYFDVEFTCDIKENCITASKLLLVALDNEAKVIIDSKKIVNEIKISQFKDEIHSLNNERESYVNKIESYDNKIESYVNKRNVLISTQDDYFEINKENIDEANNLDNLNTMLLLESINNQRQNASTVLANVSIDLANVSIDVADVSIELTEINNDIYLAKKAIEYFSALTKVKHLFKWVVKPSIENVYRKLSFSLWLTLSFLMSIALYFLAALVSTAFIKDDGHSYVVDHDKSAT